MASRRDFLKSAAVCGASFNAVFLLKGTALANDLRTTALADDPVVCCREVRSFLRSIGQARLTAEPVKFEPGKKELFIDNEVISEVKGLRRTLHQPEKFGAVITADRPWEGTIQTRTAPSWNPEKKLWMLWYWCDPGTAYATSKDGIHWEKPILGLKDYKGSKENNIIFQATPLTFVLYDPKDPDASRRYKALKYVDNIGVYPAVSPDGVHWKVLEGSFIPSQDELNLFHDEERNLFVLAVKQPGPYGRSVYLTLSRDFTHWTDPRDCLIMHADKLDQDLGRKSIEQRFSSHTLKHPVYNIPSEYSVQVYNMAIFRYGDIYLGMPAMFHQTGRVPKDWDGFSQYHLSPEILKDVHANGDWTGFHNLQLVSSRDLVTWLRMGDRQPFIDESPVNTEAYDLQTIMPASPPIIRSDGIWFYYTGLKSYSYVTSGQPDLGAICLAKLRLDGFISLDAGDASGTVTTKPMVISGETLHVNLDAPAGVLHAEILDTDQRVLNGFSLQDSIPTRGDHLDADLRWRDAKLATLVGKTIRLRFTLRNASLYAFWTGP